MSARGVRVWSQPARGVIVEHRARLSRAGGCGMDAKKISITPDGELRIKVGRNFGLDEAVLCMRDCHPHSGEHNRRVVFDLLGTQSIQTAGLGFMLMIKERCQVSKENAVILYDHPLIGQMLFLAHFEERFQLVRQGMGDPEKTREEKGRVKGSAETPGQGE